MLSAARIMGIIKWKLNKVVERYARKLAPLTTNVGRRNQIMNSLWGTVNSLAGAMVAIILGAFLLAGGLLTLRNWFRSRAWPRTRGTVEQSTVKSRTLIDDDKTRNTYHVELEYAYVVDGRRHISNRVFFGGQQAYVKEEKATHDVWALPVGSDVTVYYNPKDATESVLTVAMPRGGFFLPAMGAIFLITGLIQLVRNTV